ncbi:MAG: AMP-binding protein [Prevotellaceae bacterium]|jgi:long-chain acyl-CoA synthetase|nr:AMP-binding protein [Prevotellaceae bacterium]
MKISEKTFPKTLQQLICQSVEIYKDRPSLSFVEGEPITYEQFGESVSQTQKLLSEIGISVNDKVAILAQNMPNWGIAYFAITAMGAIVVPLLPDFSAIEIDNVLQHSETKAIFVSERLKDKVSHVNSAALKTKIKLDDFEIYENLSQIKHFDEYPNYTENPDDLAAIIYTSGTTGKPKGVMLTHKNLCSQLVQTYGCQAVNEYDIFLSILPLSHTYENSCGLILGVFGGSATYYLEKPATSSVLLPALQKIRPTLILIVPLIIEKIFREKIIKKIKSSVVLKVLYRIAFFRKIMYKKASKQLYETFGGKLIFFGIGGAKLDPVVERFLYEGKKIPYAIGYGLTECSPLVTAAIVGRVKVSSAGFPVKNVELRIDNPNPITGEGEIWMRGENIMKGYYKNPELTREVLTEDGWFRSGDLGCIDKTGRLFIRGRLKNMILSSSGENVYPEEIESIINNFKHVLESMVIERKGKLLAMVRFNYEELEKIYTQFTEDISQILEKLAEELRNYVNTRVNRASHIAIVIPLADEFEKTASQKIKRYLYTDSVISKYLN